MRIPASLANLTGWKAVVVAVIVVAIMGLRVANRMNRMKNNEQPPPAAASTLPPVTRGQDFTIDGIATIPTAAGFTWELARKEDKNGVPITSYIGTCEDKHTALTLSLVEQSMTEHPRRVALITSFRDGLLRTMQNYGADRIIGEPPSLEPPIPDRVQFEFSGRGPTGVDTQVRAVVIFGKNTFLMTAQTPDKQNVEALIQLSSNIKELGPPAGIPVVANPNVANPPAPVTHAPSTPPASSNPAPSTSSATSAASSAPSPPTTAEPPPVVDDFDVISLPAPVFATTAAAGGRLLVVQMSGVDELAVVDLANKKIAAQIPATQDALFAAGAEHLVVVTPSDRKITRWSLHTFQSEASATLDIDGTPQAIAMGYASHGPVLLHWSNPEAGFGQYSLIDLESFQSRQLTPADGDVQPGQVHLSNSAHKGIELRASADGRVFGLRPAVGSPNIERLFLGPIPYSLGETTGSGGHVVPSADGRIMCTGQGFFNARVVPRHTTSGKPCFATCDPRYFLSLNEKELQVCDVVSGQTLHSIAAPKELGNEFLSECRFGFRKEREYLTPDQRIHCVPADNLLVTIPVGDDRLAIRELPFNSFSAGDVQLDSDVLPMPGAISAAISGGGGRLAILHVHEQGVAVVVDLPNRRVVGTIPAPQDALLAAGQDVLVVLNSLDKRATRWSLRTLQEEQSTELNVPGVPRGITMGNASAGPALVYWTNDTGGAFSLLDVNKLQLQALTPAPREQAKPGEITIRTTGHSFGGVHIRAATDGGKFGIWHSTGSPTGVELLTLGRTPVSKYEHSSHGHIIPTAQGRVITGNGTLLASLKFAEEGNHPFFPTADPRYMLSVSPDAVELREIASGNVVQELSPLDDLDKDFIYRCRFGYRQKAFSLMEDQRVFCLPADDLIAMIPLTDDRIVIRDVPFDVSPAAAQPAPATVAESTPPATTASPTTPATPSEPATTNEPPAAGPERSRIWTDKSAQFRITATLVAVEGTNVVLRKADGTEITVAIEQLSERDAAYVEQKRKDE